MTLGDDLDARPSMSSWGDAFGGGICPGVSDGPTCLLRLCLERAGLEHVMGRTGDAGVLVCASFWLNDQEHRRSMLRLSRTRPDLTPCVGRSSRGQGRTALHQAVVGGDLEGVVEMLASGADPNVQDAHLQVRESSVL